LVGPSKGFTRTPQTTNSPTASHAEVHRRTEGTEKSFQNTYLPPLSPLDDENYCNMEKGEAYTSGVAKSNPSPLLDPRSPMIGEVIPEIPDRGSVIKSPRVSSNQSPQMEHPNQEILEYYWHSFNQMVQPNHP
jgi:hypothetical protein